MSHKPLRVLFDANPLSQENITGVGRSEAGLIEAMARNFPDVEFVGHYFDFLGKKESSGFKGALVKLPNVRYKRTVMLPGRFFNMLRRLRLPVPYEALVKERGDFHLFPNFLGWPSLFMTPSAPYIHDTTFVDMPQYVSKPNLFDLRTILPKVMRRSRFVITNTKSSRGSILRAFPGYNKPFVIASIPPVAAIKLDSDSIKEVLKKRGIDKPFILFHATIEPRKNLISLVEAYRLLPLSIRQSTSLIVSGGKGWLSADTMSTINQAVSEGYDIRLLGYTTDKERAALFSKTSLYVLPSFYEGFGMQILEAFTYRAPVLASDIPVLREVGGKACSYCKTDPNSIKQGILRVINDKKLRSHLVQSGSERLRLFSWDKVSHDVYKMIIRSIKN